MSGSFADWALSVPDRVRTVQMLMYTAPDGRLYVAPLETPAPDPDRAMSPLWQEIMVVRSGERL